MSKAKSKITLLRLVKLLVLIGGSPIAAALHLLMGLVLVGVWLYRPFEASLEYLAAVQNELDKESA